MTENDDQILGALSEHNSPRKKFWNIFAGVILFIIIALVVTGIIFTYRYVTQDQRAAKKELRQRIEQERETQDVPVF